jgi:hypothetical protein
MADVAFTDPMVHPSFRREHQEITALLVRVLVAGGRSEPDAARDAEALLRPLPPGHHFSRKPAVRQAGKTLGHSGLAM